MDSFEHIDKVLSVSYFKAPYGATLNPAVISEDEECLEVIVNGGVMFDDGKTDSARKCGAIFWHLGGENTIYRSLPENPYECMVFKFRVKGAPRRIAPKMSFWPDPQALRDFVWGAFRAYRGGISEDNMDAFGLYLYSTLYWHAQQNIGADDTSGMPVVLPYLLEYIENNIAEDIQISDLTDQSDISAPYLYKLFKKYFSTSPHQYILQRKMSYACKLLTGTSDQVKQICIACGINNAETFCRVFRKVYGMTPLEYRNSGGG